MLAKIEGGKRRGQQRMRWLDSITESTDMSLSKLMLAKIEGRKRREQQRMRWLDSITESVDMSKLALKVLMNF